MTKLKWQCQYCPLEFPHFKALVTHYEDCHRHRLERFQVINKGGKGQGIIQATSEDEALRFFGWTPDECKIAILPK